MLMAIDERIKVMLMPIDERIETMGSSYEILYSLFFQQNLLRRIQLTHSLIFLFDTKWG